MDSGERVECVHATACGGCPRIDLPYGVQLSGKLERVREATAAFGLGSRVRDLRGAERITEYRRRAKLVVASPAQIGLYREGTHEVVDIPHCRVVTPLVARVLAETRAMLREGDTLRAAEPGRGGVRAIDVCEAHTKDGLRAIVTWVLTGDPPEAQVRQAAHELRARVPEVSTVAVSAHDGRSPSLLGRDLRVVLGEASLAEIDADGRTRARVGPGTFVQVHEQQAHAIAATLVETMKAHAIRRAIELYAGTGATAVALAATGIEMTCVEAFAPSVELAAQVARERHVPLTVIVGDAARVARSLVTRKERFDAALVNPPRRGLAPEARHAIAALGPRVVTYTSCDPETLARDLSHFGLLGFESLEIAAFDMIPLTDEIECVATLRKATQTPVTVLFEDATLLAVAKAPHEPTTPQGEYASSLLDRVRALPGAHEATPIHRLDAGTSGVCLFARSPTHVAPWSRALAALVSKKRYTALVRGIARPKGIVRRPLLEEGRSLAATTRFKRLRVVAGHSLVEARPEQGRTHQIRRHLASIGAPVLGDARYGDPASNRFFSEKLALDRPFLHCARIELVHPHEAKNLVLEAPLAPDLALTLARLSRRGSKVQDPRSR